VDQRNQRKNGKRKHINGHSSQHKLIVENMSVLAGRANEVAVNEIIWDRNEPFVLLRHIFENIVVG
jgi:hypothetical protein